MKDKVELFIKEKVQNDDVIYYTECVSAGMGELVGRVGTDLLRGAPGDGECWEGQPTPSHLPSSLCPGGWCQGVLNDFVNFHIVGPFYKQEFTRVMVCLQFAGTSPSRTDSNSVLCCYVSVKKC